MEMVLTSLTWVFLVLGSLLMVIGGIGVLRFPDVYSRMHGAGLTDTVGAGLILTGLMFESGLTAATIRLLFILGFLWYTGPISSYALAQATLQSGIQPVLKSGKD